MHALRIRKYIDRSNKMNKCNILNISMLMLTACCLTIFTESSLSLTHAQEIGDTDNNMTIDDAVNIAIRNNPIIKSKKRSVEASKGRIKQANLMPNPKINLVAEEMPTNEIGLNESQNMVSLSQKFEIGGKRRIRTDAAKKEKSILDFDLQTTIKDITAETKKAYFEVITSQDGLKLAKITVEIAESLKNISDKKFEAGDIAKLEVLKADVELSNAKNRVVEAERNMFNAIKILQTIMGTPGVSLKKLVPVPVADVPPFKLEKLEELLLKNYPALQAQKNIVVLSLLKVKEAKRKRIPDIDFSVGYKRLSATDDDTIQAGISLPLPFFNRNQGNIIEANEISHKAKEDETAVKNKLMLQLHNAFSLYASSRELVRSFTDIIIPQAEQVLDIAKRGYAQGEFDYLEVLDAQRTLASSNITYLSSLNDYFISRTEIEKLVGVNIFDIK